MAEQTEISWADATWNPHMGCRKVSAGCRHCYAYRDMARYGRDPTEVVRSKTTFDAPLKWARNGKVPPLSRIFVCSWSDMFIREADAWRDEIWDIIRKTPQFTYLVLTKRIERVSGCLPADWGEGWRNVWMGMSAENQENLDRRRGLLEVPARLKFLSAEPLLGPLDLSWWTGVRCPDCRNGPGRLPCRHGIGYLPPAVDWIITGGESDRSNPRPCNLDWVRAIRDTCILHGIPFHHKQHGGSRMVDGAWGGREIDGRIWSEFPDA